jgi:hypothetical protein
MVFNGDSNHQQIEMRCLSKTMSFNNPYAKKRSYKGMVVMHKLYENLDLSHQSSNSI